ncbi:hypothetical protein RF11_04006 [Thelohanellus kitauei]|uniref:Uncharacterized protein n=1 Tax=Thelohanellus kitauei TaxID=669202 RepID=A0A0C2IV34_THEKT|nr:hypothetical protein RF11_04006 [Thelohanellus kitauei]
MYESIQDAIILTNLHNTYKLLYSSSRTRPVDEKSLSKNLNEKKQDAQLQSRNRALFYFASEKKYSLNSKICSMCKKTGNIRENTSSLAIGAVLVHRLAEWSEIPIDHASTSFNSHQENYSQYMRE